MGKTLLLVHGRSWKPPEDALRKLWMGAIRHAIRRDHGPPVMDAFRTARVEFIYYGQHSNRLLLAERYQGRTRVPEDLEGRRDTLEALRQWSAGQFNRARYRQLPGQESFKEGVADVLGEVLPFFGLSDALINQVAPDIREYWSDETEFGTMVRLPMIRPLQRAFKRGDSIAILAHSLGSLIVYDTLWKASHYGEWFAFWNSRVDALITIGSPLGDRTVRRRLKGYRNRGERRYPMNVGRWTNIAAEDDYIAHDATLAGDYREMKRLGGAGEIVDKKIYNLAVRNGKSNPHHAVGYLVHPACSQALADWLMA